MTITESPELTFDWAEKRWQDPLTGTDMVCLSPNKKMHFRNNYFSSNLFTFDGKYAVFIGFKELSQGVDSGDRSIWTRDMVTGEVRNLGAIPEIPESLIPFCQYHAGCVTHFAAARYSHRVNLLDPSIPDAWGIIQFDIDTGQRKRIVPSRPIQYPYFASFDASERYVYFPHKEKYHLMKNMPTNEFQTFINKEPGYQEMIRLDLESGQVETAHENIRDGKRFNLEHPNPHPVLPNLFLSGARIIDFNTGQWLDHSDDGVTPKWRGLGYYQWALAGRRFYTKQFASQHVQCISRFDLDTGEARWFAGQPHIGFAQHFRVSPNEKFMVGEGYEFDNQTITKRIQKQLRKINASGNREGRWNVFYLNGMVTNGGETIWKYVLPEETILDDEKYWRDYDYVYKGLKENPESLETDVLREPEKTIKTTPICKFRTILRSPKMLGYRLEANAQVTPDSRWVVFQSSSKDNYFEVWAARIPE